MNKFGLLPLRLASTLIVSLFLGSSVSRADVPLDYLLEWGSSGSGDGQFLLGTDVTVDENGDVYVCDSVNNRVQKFDGNGLFLLKWGSSGSATGKFSVPHAICADGVGHIYVADSANDRIQKFTTSGVFVSTFGSYGTGNGQFAGPRGIGVDASGNIYVSDTFNNRVQKFDSNGVFVTKWGSTGSANGQFRAPAGLAVDGGNVYVCDYTNDRIQVFNSAGAFQYAFGSSGSGDGQFVGVAYVTVHGSSLYASDGDFHRIEKFTTGGTFLTKWGTFGSGPGQFHYERGIDVDAAGNLYVVDTENDRIQKFGDGPGPGGNFLAVGTGRGLPGPGTISIPVLLNSFESASALDFRVADLPDWFHVTAVTAKNRATGFTASFVDDGDVHVILFSPTGNNLSPGSGEILDFIGTIDPSAVDGDSAALTITSVLMADGEGNPATIDQLDGVLYISRRPGDINGDNLVDAGDIVRLVEILLPTGDPPTPDELDAADCNADTDVNVYDLPCLVDLVLGNPAAPGGELSPLAGNLLEFGIHARRDVKALQFTIPSNVNFESTGEMSPFDVLTGVNPRGDRVIIAFDSQGGSWPQGSSSLWRAGQTPSDLRAYGPGGRPLPVEITGNDITIGAPLPPGLVILASQPNPFLGRTSIRFSVDTAGPVRLSVYDIRGGLVSTLAERTVPAGEHTWVWNALGDNGRRLSAGLYIAVVEGFGIRAPVRLTLLGN